MTQIKLSQKDKNLVSLWWMLEIVLSAIIKMDDEYIPPRKREMYKELAELLNPALDVVQDINDKFSEQINKVFEIGYQNTFADTCIAVVTLLETMKPEAVTAIIEAAGISKEIMIKKLVQRQRKERSIT